MKSTMDEIEKAELKRFLKQFDVEEDEEINDDTSYTDLGVD